MKPESGGSGVTVRTHPRVSSVTTGRPVRNEPALLLAVWSGGGTKFHVKHPEHLRTLSSSLDSLRLPQPVRSVAATSSSRQWPAAPAGGISAAAFLLNLVRAAAHFPQNALSDRTLHLVDGPSNACQSVCPEDSSAASESVPVLVRVPSAPPPSIQTQRGSS